MSPAARKQQGDVALLEAILREAPALPRALCRGEPAVFDAADEAAAERARELCGMCPELAACRRWSKSLPRDRVTGVVAGRLVRHSSSPHGRAALAVES